MMRERDGVVLPHFFQGSIPLSCPMGGGGGGESWIVVAPVSQSSHPYLPTGGE